MRRQPLPARCLRRMAAAVSNYRSKIANRCVASPMRGKNCADALHNEAKLAAQERCAHATLDPWVQHETIKDGIRKSEYRWNRLS